MAFSEYDVDALRFRIQEKIQSNWNKIQEPPDKSS